MSEMPEPTPTSPWETQEWLEESRAWIQLELDRIGLGQTGPIDQFHIRPWSTVMKIPTSDGDLYFKAASKELKHEVALTQMLKSAYPGNIPELVATDESRGWMILRDGGRPLRAALKAHPSLEHWEQVLPKYAELQIQLVDLVDRLLKAGVPDQRLVVFPNLLDRLLSEADLLRLDQEEGIGSQDLARIRPRDVARLCSELRTFGIPDTLDHGDFHDGNIFLDHGHYVFFDWGDSVISHPFFSLRTAFVSLEYTLGMEENAPEFQRLAEVYLEAWERYEGRSRLLEAYNLARRLWALNSAFRWRRAVSPLTGDEREAYAHAVPSLLQEYLEANPGLT